MLIDPCSVNAIPCQLTKMGFFSPVCPSLCPSAGVSIRAEEGPGYQQYKHEAVRQPHAHTDRCQAQVQAAVQEGGVGHAAVLPLLHLPP